ncbi:hypothetical protein CAR_c16210 [Carnobacterium sp. 17-4]|uniref:hypothetical protein n=1 Tax=Carnobacterium sp. (strain 17-4) TaxID=208596 RepID=UPI0002058FAF|nr:hypothetical protein [Carnobacterium sp. 17-4]AEB30279.1 hypothetical protein CAR_c16210 [Carnobacterium sp. 17-4]
MKKKSILNPLLVSLFPVVTLGIVPWIIYYATIISARTYNSAAFWAISISWLFTGIAMTLLSYRLMIYFDKTAKLTKWILTAWTAILIFLLVGNYFGYSLPIYAALSLLGSSFVELTLGFYISLTVLLYIKR